jgi:hypothetical protein
MSNYELEHGVTFINSEGTERHTFRDFGIYPKSKGMPEPPDVQTEFIDIPGMDGRLDATQALDGIVHYKDRDYEQDFLIVDPEADWHSIYSNLLNYLHGRKMKAVFDDDPLWYYEGRLSVGEPKADEAGYIIIPIEGTLKPYKYSVIDSTDENWLWDPFDFETGVIREYKDMQIEGRREITIIGSAMPVVPVLTVDSENGDRMTVSYGGVTYQLADGDNRIPAMSIGPGDHVMTFTGVGLVTIYFREGSL